jgi:signal transduction histidine kinase
MIGLRRAALLWLTASVIGLAPAAATERRVRTAAEAVALVHKAAAYLRQHGQARTLAEINKPDGQFVDGELYVFAFGADGSGVQLANPVYPLLVGKNVLNMQDPDGVQFIRRFLDVGRSPGGKGWVDYQWPNAMNGRFVELKTSYIERVDQLILGCGLPKAWVKN